jgi:methyl-accepting chemotaxis protein
LENIMLGKLGVGKRMLIAVSAVVVMYAATFLLAGLRLSNLARDAWQDDRKTLPYILLADDMELSRLEVQQYLIAASVTHDREMLRKAEEADKRFLDDVGKYRQLLQLDGDAQEQNRIDAIAAGFARFYTSGRAIADAAVGGIAGAGEQAQPPTGSGAGSGTGADFDRYSAAIASQLSDFRSQQIAAAHQTSSSLVGNARSAIDIMIGGGLAASLSAAFFGVWIARGVLGETGGEPAYASAVVKRVSGGDLTVDVKIKANDSGSMLFAVKDMINRISGIVADIRGSTESITIASHRIASGNADLSQRTEAQASGLQQTTSSMEELLSAVRQNAESARHAYQLAQGSCDVAEQSGAAVGKLVATMTSINDSSRRIEDIIGVIDAIAFQTNILALNAAVEAARAGEQGRGFAVVAGEVRNLAQRSATAAREIKQLIADSVGRVTVGSGQVKDAADTIGDVVTSVQLVASLMKDISATTTEQSASIEQVNTAIVQMEEFTQQNAVLVEQAAAAAEAMEQQAEALMRAVGSFKLEAAGMPGAGPVVRPVSVFRSPVELPAAAIAARKPARVGNGDWKEF